MISTCTRKQAKDGTPTITVKELQELYVGYRFIYSPADFVEYIDGLVKISFLIVLQYQNLMTAQKIVLCVGSNHTGVIFM